MGYFGIIKTGMPFGKRNSHLTTNPVILRVSCVRVRDIWFHPSERYFYLLIYGLLSIHGFGQTIYRERITRLKGDGAVISIIIE